MRRRIGVIGAVLLLTAGLSVAWRAPSETLRETIDEVLTRIGGGATPAGARIAVQLRIDACERRLREYTEPEKRIAL